MIRWSIEDENGCEGFFESKFFATMRTAANLVFTGRGRS